MMKQHLHYLFIFLFLGSCLTAFSQENPSVRIPYQAVARKADGTVLANQTIKVRTGFVEKDRLTNVYYAEQHEVTTDEKGYFTLEVGNGQAVRGNWDAIPWQVGKLWLNIELDITGDNNYQLVGRSELQTVPYAFTANSAEQLKTGKEVDERNTFSIHWNTRGNYKTVPNIHFVGTRDYESFFVKTVEKTRVVFSDRGQMTIYADEAKNDGSFFTSDQEDPDAYQLYVKGNEQGIYIEVNEPRSTENNFLTFADNNDIRGNIEGQNLEELLLSEDFINTNADFALSLGTQIAITIAEFAQGAGYVAAAAASAAIVAASLGTLAPTYGPKIVGYGIASGGAFGLGAAGVAATASIITQTIEYNVNTISTVGVSYSSGGADYAEYLKRGTLERDLFPGEVVGVRNGEISLNTEEADHLLVISEAPAVLGNVPSPERLDLFEKVAFMGQVPVKVIGDVQAGDYIIPSGKNDGLALAVAPEDLPTDQFDHIIGTAWETKTGQEQAMHRVNISIGLNRNDLAPRVEVLSDKVDNIMAFLEGKEELKDFQGASPSVTNLQPTAPPPPSITSEVLDKTIEQCAPSINQYYQILEVRLQEEGINLRNYPVWEDILNDPVAHVKQVQKEALQNGRWSPISSLIPQNH